MISLNNLTILPINKYFHGHLPVCWYVYLLVRLQNSSSWIVLKKSENGSWSNYILNDLDLGMKKMTFRFLCLDSGWYSTNALV